MRKLLYILPVILILGFAACENYVDITPTGKNNLINRQHYSKNPNHYYFHVYKCET